MNYIYHSYIKEKGQHRNKVLKKHVVISTPRPSSKTGLGMECHIKQWRVIMQPQVAQWNVSAQQVNWVLRQVVSPPRSPDATTMATTL